MVNRPKQIGTAAETAFVRYARANGFDHEDETRRAHRIVLAGSEDQGDVSLCPGVVVEVKGGHAAECASDLLIATWLDETERERRNRGATIGFLVRKRKARGAARVGDWHAHMPGETFARLYDYTLGYLPKLDDNARGYRLPAVELRVGEALELIRRAGYGSAR